MCRSKSLLLAALMSLVLFYLCCQLEAASSFDCCLGYTQHRLNYKLMVGFSEQRASEACDIDAIIFYRRKGLPVCADPKQVWVKKAIRFLSKKVMKI